MNTVSGPHLSPDDFEAWLAGALAPDARAHLDRCAECRQHADAEREVVALLASLPLLAPPPRFADRVMHAVALPDPFSVRSLMGIRRRLLATPRAAAFAATIALLLAGSMTASIVWSMGHRETLMSVGSWLVQAGWVALRGVASNLMEQPWYATLRSSFEHPARWGVASAMASFAYVLGVVALRRLLSLPAQQVAHAGL